MKTKEGNLVSEAFVKKYATIIYFTLAFVISWVSAALIAGPSEIINIKNVALEGELALVIVAMVIGPTVAGLFSTWLVGRKEGLKDLLTRFCRWNVGARWYMALFIAPATLVVTDLLLSLFSRNFYPTIFSMSDKTSFLGFTLFGALVGGFFEEIGWTGFAIPRMLKRLSVFKTGLFLGLIWGAWHFLVNFWGSANSAGAVPLALFLLVALFSFLLPYRILMVWVYDHTKSLLLSILMHCNLITFWLILAPTEGSGSYRVIWFLTWTVILWGTVIAVNNLTKGGLFRKS
jgi:membrane protease YdiL (CAAX protease family)